MAEMFVSGFDGRCVMLMMAAMQKNVIVYTAVSGQFSLGFPFYVLAQSSEDQFHQNVHLHDHLIGSKTTTDHKRKS
jgi:hypothetical protein